MSAPTRPVVYWLVAAQRSLRAALAHELAAARHPGPFHERRQGLSDRLADVFSGARAVVVRDRMAGYRPSPDQHVLLVEVIPRADQPDPEEPGVFIVKMGEAADMQEELEAWQRCRPPGFAHDNLLVALHGGFAQGTSELLALIYGDAFQVLGTRDVVSFEEAALACCQYGHPAPAAIDALLRVLYQRLDDYFYRQSYTAEPADYLANGRLPSLCHLLWCYDEPGQAAGECPDPARLPANPERLRWRREALGFLYRHGQAFLDPGDYLLALSRCHSLAPRVQRGCSHGDLHGRNFLVHVGESAVQGALFDYENMGPNNLIGWDFVKLETELKARALPALLGGLPEPAYVDELYRFEAAMAHHTQALYRGDAEAHLPPRPYDGNEGLCRLALLVLGIRRHARRHLELLRGGRHSEWLREYYFLLAWYGLRGGLFATYQRRMFLAAYVSAGVACAQLDTWRGPHGSEEPMLASAALLLDQSGRPALPEELRARPDNETSYRPRFAFARYLVRNGHPKRPDAVEVGVELLRALRGQYPHAIEIDEELVLGLLELDRVREADAVLAGVQSRYEVFSEEILARWGRVYKQRALALLANEGASPRGGVVEAELRRSLEYYERAYSVRSHYFPGINVASLNQLLGNDRRARLVAHEILAELKGTDHDRDTTWVPATRGEACLLLGQNDQARAHYQEAGRRSDPRDKMSMRRQVELLCGHGQLPNGSAGYWTAEVLDDLFGA